MVISWPGQGVAFGVCYYWIFGTVNVRYNGEACRFLTNRGEDISQL